MKPVEARYCPQCSEITCGGTLDHRGLDGKCSAVDALVIPGLTMEDLRAVMAVLGAAFGYSDAARDGSPGRCAAAIEDIRRFAAVVRPEVIAWAREEG
jgi:hypothetical protein